MVDERDAGRAIPASEAGVWEPNPWSVDGSAAREARGRGSAVAELDAGADRQKSVGGLRAADPIPSAESTDEPSIALRRPREREWPSSPHEAMPAMRIDPPGMPPMGSWMRCVYDAVAFHETLMAGFLPAAATPIEGWPIDAWVDAGRGQPTAAVAPPSEGATEWRSEATPMPADPSAAARAPSASVKGLGDFARHWQATSLTEASQPSMHRDPQPVSPSFPVPPERHHQSPSRPADLSVRDNAESETPWDMRRVGRAAAAPGEYAPLVEAPMPGLERGRRARDLPSSRFPPWRSTISSTPSRSMCTETINAFMGDKPWLLNLRV